MPIRSSRSIEFPYRGYQPPSQGAPIMRTALAAAAAGSALYLITRAKPEYTASARALCASAIAAVEPYVAPIVDPVRVALGPYVRAAIGVVEPHVRSALAAIDVLHERALASVVRMLPAPLANALRTPAQRESAGGEGKSVQFADAD